MLNYLTFKFNILVYYIPLLLISNEIGEFNSLSRRLDHNLMVVN